MKVVLLILLVLVGFGAFFFFPNQLHAILGQPITKGVIGFVVVFLVLSFFLPSNKEETSDIDYSSPRWVSVKVVR